MLGEKIDIDGSALHTIAGSSNGAHRASPVGPHDPPEESANAPAKQLRTPWTSTPASPTTTSPDKDRYERLREEATKQGMKMLEEEKERNNEMTALLKARVESLEAELERTRSRLGKKCAQYEEVLKMANEIALAYEHRSTHSTTRDCGVQTDTGKWRDYRSAFGAEHKLPNVVQPSSHKCATAQDLATVAVQINTDDNDESDQEATSPHAPLSSAGGADRTCGPVLAMHFPCSRARKLSPSHSSSTPRLAGSCQEASSMSRRGNKPVKPPPVDVIGPITSTPHASEEQGEQARSMKRNLFGSMSASMLTFLSPRSSLPERPDVSAANPSPGSFTLKDAQDSLMSMLSPRSQSTL